MKAPAFWWDRRRSAASRLLLPLGAVYGWIAARRMQRQGMRTKVPVICIGNFVAGGAGKTPTAIGLAQALIAQGHRPVFLTRGYGSKVRVPQVVDSAIHDAATVGDEALLLARIAPVVVSPDRVKGAELATTLGSLILMDDGMQNPALHKDLTIAVVDGGVGLGNRQCIPAGPLRAPFAVQIQAVDAVLIIGTGAACGDVVDLVKAAGKPVFRSGFAVNEAMTEHLAGKKALAFAGIGRPEKFFETLGAQYVKLEQVRHFADHHRYTDEDARALLQAAEARKLQLITTEKDYVKLRGSTMLDNLRQKTMCLPVVVSIPAELVAMVSACCAKVGTGFAIHDMR